MNEPLVRFGVAMEPALLMEFDRVVEARGGTRSEALRDMARAAVARSKIERGVEAMGVMTLVYDHHVRDLTEKLTELQHDLGDKVRSSLHIHLDHDRCLEVVVMRGRSDQLQRIADRIHALRGVQHGGIELIAEAHTDNAKKHSHARPVAKKTKPRSKVQPR